MANQQKPTGRPTVAGGGSNARQEVEKGTQELVQASNQLPDYLRDKVGKPAKGLEGAQQSDFVIPRLEIVQSLSPARQKDSAEYIEGAEEGMLYNNVTREIYGTEVMVVPVFFKKDYLLWLDRKISGGKGGFRGAYPNEIAAKTAINDMDAEKEPHKDKIEAIETNQHFCFIVRGDGKVEEIVMSMSKTKLKVSRKWNSLMKLAEIDTYAKVYKVRGIVETNARNEKFYNFDIASAGFVPQDVYARAEVLHEKARSGKATVNYDDLETETTAGGERTAGTGPIDPATGKPEY